MTGRGWEDLRPRREQMGLSLEEVSIATRIGVAYLVALEEGHLDELPEGPYRAAYLRAYREVLELEEVALDPGDTASPRQRSQWAVRAVTAAVVLVLFAVVAWQAAQLLGGEAAPASVSEVEASEDLAATDPLLDQRVSIRALERTRLRVEVDGALAWEGRLDRGERLSFAGRDEVAVDLPASEVVRVSWNEQLISPQGRLDVPRRLVFIDDQDRREP